MIEITVGICESLKVIGIDISEADLRKFEKALYERGLNVAPRTVCLALKQNTGPNDPADCAWPGCGCDPRASKVIEALEESGAFEQKVPSGWRLVPIEPTSGMVGAAFEARDHVANALSSAAEGGFSSGVMCVYGAMIEAAPMYIHHHADKA